MIKIKSPEDLPSWLKENNIFELAQTHNYNVQINLIPTEEPLSDNSKIRHDFFAAVRTLKHLTTFLREGYRFEDNRAEDKIAAIGIRLRKWISFHGISINVEPDLDHFSGIIPCGITDYGVTSLADLGLPATMQDLDMALQRSFGAVFGNMVSPVKNGLTSR